MSESLSMYQASVPVLIRALRNFKHILAKGQAHALAQGYDPAVLLQSRLYPDMLPLLRQVQIATDTAKFAPARLAGMDSPRFEDNETSFDELQARLDRALEFLGSFTPAQVDGSEGRDVVLPRRSGDQHPRTRPPPARGRRAGERRHPRRAPPLAALTQGRPEAERDPPPTAPLSGSSTE